MLNIILIAEINFLKIWTLAKLLSLSKKKKENTEK